MEKFLNIQQVCTVTTLSRATIWRMRNRGEFPAPRPLGCQRVGFVESEVADWIAKRAAAKSN